MARRPRAGGCWPPRRATRWRPASWPTCIAKAATACRPTPASPSATSAAPRSWGCNAPASARHAFAGRALAAMLLSCGSHPFAAEAAPTGPLRASVFGHAPFHGQVVEQDVTGFRQVGVFLRLWLFRRVWRRGFLVVGLDLAQRLLATGQAP